MAMAGGNHGALPFLCARRCMQPSPAVAVAVAVAATRPTTDRRWQYLLARRSTSWPSSRVESILNREEEDRRNHDVIADADRPSPITNRRPTDHHHRVVDDDRRWRWTHSASAACMILRSFINAIGKRHHDIANRFCNTGVQHQDSVLV
jgi:hypothetical protein